MVTKQRDPAKGVSLSAVDNQKGSRTNMAKASQQNPGENANTYKGMRSPLLNGSESEPSENAPQAFGENGTSGKADHEDPFAGTGPQILSFRAPPKKFNATPYIALLLVIIGGVIYVETMEQELARKIHKTVLNYVQVQKEQLPQIMDPQTIRSKTTVLSVDTPTAGAKAVGTKKAFDPLRLGCDKILALQKSGETELTSKFFQVATECSFAQLDYLSALRQSEVVMKQFRKTAENVSSEIWLMRVRSLLAMGLSQEAEKTIGKNCEKWQKSAPCVAKLHLLIKRGFLNQAESGFNQLERLPLTKGNRIDVDLLVAAANAASALGQYDAAERRLQTAIKYAPEDSPFSWKEIFEARMWNVARKGDPTLSGKILREARENVFIDPKTFGPKLILINSLSQSDNTKLNAYFLESKMPRSKIVDIEFFEILSYEAIKRNLLNTYFPFASTLRKNVQTINEIGKPNRNLFDLLEARANIAQNKPNKSYQQLKGMQGTPFETATAAMLRGVSLHMLATNDQYHIFALTEFLDSYRLYPSWQSLWAAGHLYSVLNQSAKAKPVIAKLKQDFGRVKEAAAWTRMLEFRITALNLPQAQADAQIDAALNKNGNNPYLWQIKLDSLQQTKRFDAWRNLDRQLLKQGLLTSNPALPEMKWYPLGALVLTN